MSILVTGGAGFIGSHVCVALLEKNYDVVVIDNLCNASAIALKRVEQITEKRLSFYPYDLRNREAINTVFEKENITAVIHLAGLKSVYESVQNPLLYYNNNLAGTLVLCDVMKSHGINKMIFSSSATVYGKPAFLPITEECPKGTCTNPYGWSKWMIEQILTDLYQSDSQWHFVFLRYFNPSGAHHSGKIGEDPRGVPNNLIPYIAQVAIGKRAKLSIYGNDYNTPDGTGVRDYIHVMDLAMGHVQALEKLDEKTGVFVYNLGTGNGHSVLEVIKTFSEVCGKEIPYEIHPRRPGDIAISYCDTTKAQSELQWSAKRSLFEMCEDAWRWQCQNPDGYGE